MGDDRKIAGRIKGKITRFSNWPTEGLKRPDRKFIREIIYGVQVSKDVKLSNIARALWEEVALIKTEGRLSRNISKADLTEAINNRLIEAAKARIKEDTVLAVDIGGVDKPYARAMENQASVRAGSSGERRSAGYWTIEVIGADIEGEELVPLYGEL